MTHDEIISLAVKFVALVAESERNIWLDKLTRADWEPINVFRSYYPTANGDWVDLRELKEIINERNEK